MQLSTTSAALLVQIKLMQAIAEVNDIDPEEIEQEIEEYLAENGLASPGFLYDRNSIVAATWIIDHDLNKYPQVTLIDEENNVMDADIFYSSLNQVTVTFSVPTAGKAVLL